MLKKELRKLFLQKRKSLTDNELSTFSQNICDQLFQFFAIDSYAHIHIFLPIKKQNEINTWLIINKLQKDFSHLNIIIPRIHTEGTMENYFFTAEANLEENSWGILEPIGNEKRAINSQHIDLVIIPLLIFDKKGYRVGYGKGFYDRFLAECPPTILKIGLSIFEPIEAIEDVNEFDLKMDYCVTTSKIWTF